MTDLELLELAAKAAGYPIHSNAWSCSMGGGTPTLFMGNFGPKWNPLTDDGDALRLAVNLGLLVDVIDNDPEHCTEVVWRGCYATHGYRIRQEHETDAGEATRRAIVRAAAEIGKDM